MKTKTIIFFAVISINNLFSQSIDYDKFKGEKINLYYLAQIFAPRYYVYSKNDTFNIENGNVCEGLILKENRLEGQQSIPISFLRKLSFIYNGFKTEIVVYKIDAKSIHKFSTYQYKNNKWILLDDSYIKPIENVLYKLKSDAFFEFYNNENNPKYPEIDKLRALTKDSDGVLNIFKLAEVIEKNKKELAKYLEK